MCNLNSSSGGGRGAATAPMNPLMLAALMQMLNPGKTGAGTSADPGEDVTGQGAFGEAQGAEGQGQGFEGVTAMGADEQIMQMLGMA